MRDFLIFGPLSKVIVAIGLSFGISSTLLASDFRWVVYNNSQHVLKISTLGSQVQNKALPYKYFWSTDYCVWIDRSSKDYKNLRPSQQRGWDCTDPQIAAVNPKRKFRVRIQCPNGNGLYVFFPRTGGFFPKGHKSNSNVEYQLILEDYDCP